MPPSELEFAQETDHVLTTNHDSEVTIHQLGRNISLQVLKEEYFAGGPLSEQFFYESNRVEQKKQLVKMSQDSKLDVFSSVRSTQVKANEAMMGPSEGCPADEAHHIYTYTLEVSDPVIQVDIRLDFADSQNVEVVDDENVLREDDGRSIVVGSVMPMTTQIICRVKAFDYAWKLCCQVTMVKRSAPKEI